MEVVDNMKYEKYNADEQQKQNIILGRHSIYIVSDINHLHVVKASWTFSIYNKWSIQVGTHFNTCYTITVHLHRAKMLYVWCPYMKECEWWVIVSQNETTRIIAERVQKLINEYWAFPTKFRMYEVLILKRRNQYSI